MIKKVLWLAIALVFLFYGCTEQRVKRKDSGIKIGQKEKELKINNQGIKKASPRPKKPVKEKVSKKLPVPKNHPSRYYLYTKTPDFKEKRYHITEIDGDFKAMGQGGVFVVLFFDLTDQNSLKALKKIQNIKKRFNKRINLIVKPVGKTEQSFLAAELFYEATRYGKGETFLNLLAKADTPVNTLLKIKELVVKSGVKAAIIKADLQGVKASNYAKEVLLQFLRTGIQNLPAILVNGKLLDGDVGEKLLEQVLIKEEKFVKSISKKRKIPEKEVYQKVIEKKFPQANLVGEEVFKFDLSNSPFIGSSEAYVKIVFFVDYECAFSRNLFRILKNIQRDYKKKVAVFFKNFPQKFHKHAKILAKIALCIKDKKTFSDFLDKVFVKKVPAQKLVDFYFKDRAIKVCVKRKDIDKILKLDLTEAKKTSLKGTPGLFINGRKIKPPRGFTENGLKKIIEKFFINIE